MLLLCDLGHGAPPGSLSYPPPALAAPRPELELDYRGGGGPEALRGAEDALDTLLEDEDMGSGRSPPASPRDFPRMQDIPEEVESGQELRDGDGDS
ncbi:hypothetical protein AV530_017750 [Patagioenas fasciata monilis]|uniref:Uncharacterized protein n=1 Tax=Patagioenas fasciata monilis TaxID=372326 RepID=A0A1V4KFS3_PATFA|nr:hypothetical protein AV530_017750 [Patagioenas fasciata monilis]